MANWKVCESSMTDSYEAVKTNEHQREFMFFKATTALEAYPVSTPDFAYAAPYSNGSSNTDFAAEVSDSQEKPYKDFGLKLTGCMDEEERRKLRKRLQNRESARKSKHRRKLEIEELEAKVKTICGETSMLTKDIMRYSNEILTLSSENEALLEELRHMCDQETISRLESMDPENSSQNQPAPYESDQSSDGAPSSD